HRTVGLPEVFGVSLQKPKVRDSGMAPFAKSDCLRGKIYAHNRSRSAIARDITGSAASSRTDLQHIRSAQVNPRCHPFIQLNAKSIALIFGLQFQLEFS